MIKEVVVLNSEVINIGPWDEQIRPVLVSSAEYDEEGNITKEAVYEDRVMNPMPEGAVIEEREIETAPDGGLIVKGSAQPTTAELMGQELARLKLQTMQQTQLMTSLGAELAVTKLELMNLKGDESK
ncbi:MAG: XkdW family protein [Bacillota bacterium]